jgi:CheY-like chemotaxis protein
MSHEIRTPLNGVIGMAEMLAPRLEKPENQRMLKVISDSGHLLLVLVNDILDLSKIEAGQLELENRLFHPAALAARLEAAYAVKADAKGLRLAFTVTEAGALARLGDESRMMQIAHNLLSNAVKFTERGAVSVVVDGDTQGHLTLTVRDTGIGMTEAQVARMFDEFAQGDSSTTRRYGGSGLGMAIVRKLLDLMAGTISVESALGHGTTVKVAVPVAVSAEPCAPHRSPPAPGETLLPLRVLAVDDNEINRMVLGAMLESLGVTAMMLDNGLDAIEAAGRQAFDVLLIDISMPGIDGIETLHRIRALPAMAPARDAPAIAVTANAMAHQVKQYLKAGFAAHVAKPIDLDLLKTALADIACAKALAQA